MGSPQRLPNGIFVLLGGVLNFTGLGYYYTVGSLIPTIKVYLMKHNFGENSSNANWFPTLILLTSAVVMPLAGIMERRTIFKVPLLLSALFCSLGILLSHLSVKSGYAFFTLTYCVMYGIGFGLNYSITPSVVLEWYSNNQCLACGSVFFGLGVGSIFFSQIQTYIVKPQKCDFNPVNVANCEAANKVPSLFMINGSIIFAVQMLGTILMCKKPNNEFDHEGEYTNEEIALHPSNTVTTDVKPRDLIRYRAFFILWLIQLCECFPTTTFLSLYKTIGTVAVKSSFFIHMISEVSTAFLLVGFILWSFLADKVSYKIPLLSAMLIWLICLSSAPRCLQFQPVYATLVFVSVLCIAGYRILLFVATAKAFGIKYLSFNFACINTASIFGGILCTFFTIYFPNVQRPDLVLYICASLNAAALILGSFLPDKESKCCQPKIRALKDSREIETSKNFAEE